MGFYNWTAFWRPLAFGALCLVPVASATAASPVAPEEWELPEEHLRDNGFRGDVILNAWWEARASEDAPLERIAIPEAWGPYSGYTYSRNIDLPEGWESRRLVLEVDNFSEDGSVYWNGERIAEVRAVAPLVLIEVPEELITDGPQRLSITTGLVRGDVWLFSFPRGETAIDDTYITTSYRDREVNIDLAGRAAPASGVRPVVRIFDDAETSNLVLTLEADQPIVADERGQWKTSLRKPWENPRLWSQWDPNLYWYTVELIDENGATTDKVLPRRFGFREVWQEGKQMVLNGVPLHFSGDMWAWLLGATNTTREQAWSVMEAMKDIGIHSGWRVRANVGLEAADELGMILSYQIIGGLNIPLDIAPALRPGEAGDDGGDHMLVAGDLAAYRESQERLDRVIRRWREHPSIMSWLIGSPWSRFTLHSELQGVVRNPWDYWPGNQNPENNRLRYHRADRSHEFVRRLDPHRPVAAQNQPDVPLEFSTRYLCDDLDLQEREQFFKHYSEGPSEKVLWPSEFGMPFHGHQFLRRSPHQMPQSAIYPAIHIENAARLFGDEVFLQESDGALRRWHRTPYYGHVPSEPYQRLTAENVERVWRGWRTAGVSGQAHWILREGYTLSDRRTSEERIGAPHHRDPRRPGLSRVTGNMHNPPGSTFPLPGVDTRLKGGEAYYRGIAPLLAYIGGGEGNVYNKDHLFYAGDTVKKQVVVLSDYHDRFELRGTWQLTNESGSTLKEDDLRLTVEPGMRALDRLPIRFDLPDVDERTEFTFRIQMETDEPRQSHLEDEFTFTAFPRHRPSDWTFGGRVWYAHPGPNNELREMLQSAGIRNARRLPDVASIQAGEAELPGADDLLVIPRRFFVDAQRDHEFENERLIRAIDLDHLVEEGLRLLVLEQDVENLFGMKTEHVRPRRVFKAAPGHPAFDGLGPRDLTYWSGKSNLDPHGEVGAITSSLKKFPDRIWHVTTENAVATRTLIRPQTGSVRALAVSGFNLHESPLLEVTRGHGRMIFCMLDVSNRYGTDPAATRIVDNLLHYLANAERPDPERSEIAHHPVDDSKVVERANTFRAERPDGEDGWGITRGELFFRDSIYENNWITRRLPHGRIAVFAETKEAELPAVIRRDSSTGLFETTLDESDFETGWSRKKIGLVRAALVVNQNGSRLDGPSLTLHGNRVALYPHRWVDGFVHPYTAAGW